MLENVEVGPMGAGAASQRADDPGPLRLQGDHGGVSFRNVRICQLSKEDAERIHKQIEKQQPDRS